MPPGVRGHRRTMRLFGRRIRQVLQQPVVVDDRGVRRSVGDEAIEAVGWDELTGVDVVTTSDGPFAEDVFLVLSAGDDHGCVVPQAAATDELVDRLLALEGFDHEAFMTAMSSVTEARFVCWRA
jgi:hypothetical protein